MEERTVLFDSVAERNPNKVAIYWGNDRIRYRDLGHSIDTFATNLSTAAGIHRQDRVGILLKNSPSFIYSLYGALKLGAVVVPVNTFLKAPEIQHIVDDCQLKCLISEADFDELTDKLRNVKIVQLAQLSRKSAICIAERQAPITNQQSPISPSDLALIIYTSGTTGKSKGAMLTHGNITSNVHSCIKALEETADDRLTLLLPMFHSFMLTVCIFTPLLMGAGIVLIKSVQPFKAALKEIIRGRATVLVGIPQLFQAMAQAKVPFWLHWVLKLRMAVSGAAPLARETLENFERKFRFPLLEGYGLSEASPVVSFNPIHGVRKAGSVGLSLPDVEVKIFDENDAEVDVDTVGEIVVRGPNVMQGYHNQPAETAAALRNGWLHTGDMGRKDVDGYIYIVDRRKEMLLVRGMNVYPREIEEVLYKFPSVRDAAVVPKQDEKRGEVPVAFVVPCPGATLHPHEIVHFCRQQLADYKVPRHIKVVEDLPRTATGKVAKLELQKML
jgi:long-chain acyl-CoA synthetase